MSRSKPKPVDTISLQEVNDILDLVNFKKFTAKKNQNPCHIMSNFACYLEGKESV